MTQVLSLLGAALILVAFAGSQLRRLAVRTVSYQLLNLTGSATLTGVALVERQYGFLLLEGVWALASAAGLWSVLKRPGA